MKKLLLLLLAVSAYGQVTNAVLAPPPQLQFINAQGKPFVGAYLCTFAAGTTTPLATYTDYTGGTPNTNPIVLDALGTANVWVKAPQYKFILYSGGNGSCPGSGMVILSKDHIMVPGVAAGVANGYATLDANGHVPQTQLAYVGADGTTRQLSNKVSVTLDVKNDFGAVCDGSTDDSAAITAAVTTASSLLFPSGTCVLASSVTIPATTSIIFQKGAMLSIASTKVLTISSDVQAGNFQIFAGAGSIVLNTRTPTNALWFPGADIGAQVNAAVVALGRGCGHIVVPRKTSGYSTATTFLFDDTQGCYLDGDGGWTNTTPTSNIYITYTGTSNILSARSTVGFRLAGFGFLTTNASFAAKGFDFSHSAGLGTDTTGADISNFSLIPNSGGKFSIAVDMNQAVDSHIHDGILFGYVIGINGATDSTYSNANHLENITFESSASAPSSYSILNPGQGWEMSNLSFENNNTALVPIGCNMTDPEKAAGVHLSGSWFGDWVNAANTTQIEVCGHAWNIGGNFLAGTFTGSTNFTEIAVADDVAGTVVTGNDFAVGPAGVSNILTLGSSTSDILWAGNRYPTLTGAFLLSGSCVTGYLIDNTGANLCPASGYFTGDFNPTSAASLPTTVGGSGAFFTGGYSSPTIMKTYIGNGSGFEWDILKRNTGTDTTLGSFTDGGVFTYPTIKATTSFSANGTAGMSVTKTVKGSAGSNCDLVFTMGLLTSTTCP